MPTHHTPTSHNHNLHHNTTSNTQRHLLHQHNTRRQCHNLNTCLLLLLLATNAQAQDTQDEPLGPVIGIDLGTTYSCVGVWRNGNVEIIANDQGNRVTPSYVAFTDTERLVGDAAKTQASLNPTNTVYDAKRLIGRAFGDAAVQSDIAYWPFKVVKAKGSKNKPAIQVKSNGKTLELLPQEVSAMILTRMKETAEAYLGVAVKNIVVTVPAYFNDAQRQATKDAGQIAGLNVLRILNEPTAAAIAYGLDRALASTNVLVFDLGGGTFDVSLLSVDSGVFEVLATAGDTHLGGEDLDNRIIEHLLSVFKRKHPGKDLSKNMQAMSKLRREAERAKRQLSTLMEARVEIESLLPGVDLSESITRAKFEDLCADLFRQTLVPVERVLEDAGLTKADVDEVVLVGGSTRIPKVRQLLKKYFDGKEPSTNINADEAVAFGAAVQAGILGGERDSRTKDMLLLDVIPLSLGIETTGGVMATIIPRNTVIPARKSSTYTNVEDNQVAVTNKVFEGERGLTKDNRLLGEFVLSGFPPMAKGTAEIEVSFDVDANGILTVSAVERKSNQEAVITIENSDRLADEVIDRMVRDAEGHKAKDEEKVARVVAQAELEQFIYDTRQKLKDTELRGKMDEDDVLSIQNELLRTDQFLDATPSAPKQVLVKRLAQLRDGKVNPILRKYAPKRVRDESGPESFYEDEFGDGDDHDEL